MTPREANADQFAEITALRDRVASLTHENAELREALAQASHREGATSEILRVISRSPTDVQPVFAAIVENAARLCDGVFSTLISFDGQLMRLEAAHNWTPEAFDHLARSILPAPPSRALPAGRAILDCAVIHLPDIELDQEFRHQELTRAVGFRSILTVPMLRDGVPLGAISVARAEPGAFSDNRVALLQTFAAQAVIAIENVRLFNETKEALEQQTAMSEILRVISGSPTDIQPVLDAVAVSAARVCGATDAVILRVDGQETRRVAHSGAIPLILPEMRRITPGSPGGRAILECRSIHVHDAFDAEFAREYPETAAVVRDAGWRTILVVPLVREAVALGVISIRRTEVRPFTDKEIALLQTFADQAVIAIENVRLFKELQTSNRELTTALDTQTATSDILGVISRSQTDVQPVFDAIVQSAVRLLRAHSGMLTRVAGDWLELAAFTSIDGAYDDAMRAYWPRPLHSKGGHTQAIRERAPINIADAEVDPRVPEAGRAVVRLSGFRSVASVPLLRNDEAIGTVAVTRQEPGGFTNDEISLLQTFADQAVIAIENVRLFKELEARNHDLTEALDQQTATGEVLRIISSSPTDVQPTFDAIAKSAAMLCRADFSGVHRFDGDLIHFAAQFGRTAEEIEAVRQAFPQRPSRASATARCILSAAVVQVADHDEDPDIVDSLRVFRTVLAVPMLRDGRPVGSISVARRVVNPFTDDQVDLLKTFADQAVIAIENVRLFTELQDKNQALTTALEQQTATSEILKVISSSPTDAQPVFDAILSSAMGLMGAYSGALTRVSGDELQLSAFKGSDPGSEATLRAAFPRSLREEGSHADAVRRRAAVNIRQAQSGPEGGDVAHAIAQAAGYQSMVVVPLLHHDIAIGTIAVVRREPGGFADDEIALLQTFADQAVIAIENVRLFTELQEKNHALTAAHAEVTETLEQQTATADVLKVISRSTFDLQPVLNTLIESATRLCGADKGFIFKRDGDVYRGVADSGTTPEHREYIRRIPVRVDRSTVVGRVALERRTMHFPDILLDPEYQWAEAQRIAHFRTVLGVPMLRGGEPIGAFFIWREEVRPFTDKQIELVTTFADQAVIAIENTRLLSELRARTDDLTRSVGQLTALGEVGRAVSSTLDLETVLSTIVSRAVQLSGLDGGVVFEYDEGAEEFVQRAMTQTSEVLAEARRATRIRKGEGVLGRTATTLEPVQVADIAIPGAYEGRLREVLIHSGIRAILAVPMVREDHLIGCLGVTRNSPGEFPAATIELLRTFATQSALAIQNARLFREIEQKSRQLEAASQHKSEFLANMSHELRTPLNAIIGFSEVLSERMFGELNEKQEEYLKDIHASGQHLLSLINDILDLSKIEAGKMELELSNFDLPITIDNALTLIRERAARRSIALHTAVDERLGQIQADERKLRQVLLNLLSNAIKFTPEGGRINIGAKPVDGSIEVSVSDTGVGIAPEDQEAVFEEFRQVGPADKKIEGTGLGLALSRKFIELHGGKIWVKSEVGVGSTFTFTIPVRRGE
jgi:GAF domain-containing protein